MSTVWTPVSYHYDGTFAGFLSCIFDSYRYREEPILFSTPEETQYSLYPVREVSTSQEHARRVYRSLENRLSIETRRLVSLGFLTCLPHRERHLYQFIRLGYEVGPSAAFRLSDPRVSVLRDAVVHLNGEVQLFKGFVRFSQYSGLLAGEIAPKNRVLPLLRPHFCTRFSEETFLLYDKTHREALFYTPNRWAIAPIEELTLGRPEEEELSYRQLWRRFYDTIAIQSRYNPKLRMTHMPKRYWQTMTEFQTDSLSRTSQDAFEPSNCPAGLLETKRERN